MNIFKVVQRNWPKRYTVVGMCFLGALICYMDRIVMSVAIVGMQESFGYSETLKGIILSSFFIGYMLFQVPAGYLSNRVGGVIALGIAVAWWSLFTLVTPLAAMVSVTALIVARICMGLGETAMFPAAFNLFSRWVPVTERSRSVAFMLTGIPIGAILALIVTGWIIRQFGWEAVFYIFGLIGFVWVMAWLLLVRNKPEDHPGISPQERELLLNPSMKEENDRPSVVPWKKLFTSSAVWALIINHFCTNWGFYVLMVWLPSYFQKTQGLSIEYAGLFSAIPWVVMTVFIFLSSWAADYMVARGVKLTTVRKSMQCIGLIGSSIFLLSAIGANSVMSSLVAMCGALGMIAFTWSGFGPNHLDIAPRYADVLMGITNTVGTLPGVIGVIITGWLIDITGTYSSAFVLTVCVNMTGVAVWLIFGTGKKVID